MDLPANPTPYTYENDIYAAGLNNERSQISFDPTNWESLAKECLSTDSFGYLWGSAGTRQTDDNNREAFKKWGILPSRLVDADFPKLKTSLFGEEYDYPIAIAPVGVQTIFHPDGEVATAKAADAENVTYILRTAASTSIENVADASGPGPRWYQLYWPSNDHMDITASLLKRAKGSGYKVLVVTLDTSLGGDPAILITDITLSFAPTISELSLVSRIRSSRNISETNMACQSKRISPRRRLNGRI